MKLPAEIETRLERRDAPVRLWWRDDDAGRPDPALDLLLDLVRRHAVPASLAVVPRWLEPGVIERLRRTDSITILQHGIEHRDHAREGARKIELGGLASPADLAKDLIEGREALAAAFGAAFRPVLVPPWNRIDQVVADLLPACGFMAVSGWRRSGFTTPPGLKRLDAHLDAMHWRPRRRCLSLAEMLDGLAVALGAEPDGPIGLLTHHLVVDQEGWRALDRFVGLVQDHPKLEFASAPSLLMEAS